jgi:predicted dehydrogenase
MTLTVGVLGLDHPHAQGHLAALATAPEIAALRIWDADRGRLRQQVAKLPNAQAVSRPEELIDRNAVDALVVLLPTARAQEWTLSAIQTGLSVFADKPGATNAAAMESIVRAAQETGAHFCPCYPWRTEPAAHEVAKLLADGVLGDLWSFEATWLTTQVALRGPDSWLFQRHTAGGGILLWLACHWLDLLRVLVGPATEVDALVTTRCEQGIDVEDVACLLLRLQNGAIGTLRAGYLHRAFEDYDDSDLHLSFEGSLGALFWPTARRDHYRLRTRHEAYADEPLGWVRASAKTASDAGRQGYYPMFLKRFLEAVQGKGDYPATEQDALYVLRVAEAAYRSSDSGVRQPLETPREPRSAPAY